MAAEQFANNAQTTLNGAITSPTATSIAVSSASGFPSSAQFRILVDSELMLVTSGAGTTTWAVTRGIEGTTAGTHANGATVTQVLTAGALANLDGSQIATGTVDGDRGIFCGRDYRLCPSNRSGPLAALPGPGGQPFYLLSLVHRDRASGRHLHNHDCQPRGSNAQRARVHHGGLALPRRRAPYRPG